MRGIFLACALSLVVAFVAACGGMGDDEAAADRGASAGVGVADTKAGTAEDVAINEPAGSIGGVTTVPGPDSAMHALPRLLDLGADKCIPCKAMAPILEEMRGTFEGKLRVDFVDVWKDRSAAEQYDVKVIPTQIFFDGEGSELFRHQGFFSREDMLAKWGELGYEFEG